MLRMVSPLSLRRFLREHVHTAAFVSHRGQIYTNNTKRIFLCYLYFCNKKMQNMHPLSNLVKNRNMNRGSRFPVIANVPARWRLELKATETYEFRRSCSPSFAADAPPLKSACAYTMITWVRCRLHSAMAERGKVTRVAPRQCVKSSCFKVRVEQRKKYHDRSFQRLDQSPSERVQLKSKSLARIVFHAFLGYFPSCVLIRVRGCGSSPEACSVVRDGTREKAGHVLSGLDFLSTGFLSHSLHLVAAVHAVSCGGQ